MKNFLQRLDYFFSSKCYLVNKEWDVMLVNLLNNHKIIKRDEYTVTFDTGQEVWIYRSYSTWYEFGQPYVQPYRNIEVLPTAATAIRLWNLIKEKRPKNIAITEQLAKWNNVQEELS